MATKDKRDEAIARAQSSGWNAGLLGEKPQTEWLDEDQVREYLAAYERGQKQRREDAG